MGAIGRVMERLPLLERRRPAAYALVVVFAAVAWWVRLVLDPIVPPGLPFVTFLPAVIVSCFLFGLRAGLLAAALCALLAWYWFLPGGRGFALDRGRVVALVFFAAVATIDLTVIHWMQRANERLRHERERSAQLAERTELLFRELQHRVSNNIQMAGAVLTLHGRGIADAGARQAVADASTKLQTIGRIQRQLYDTSGAQLPLDAMLPELVADLVDGGGKPGIRTRVTVEPGILLPPDAAIPVALILAESVANAIEHGFAGRDEGLVTVAAVRAEAGIEVSVADDGRGLPDGFDVGAAESMGLQIAATLARQLGAVFALEPSPSGAVMRLRLPADLH